MTSNPGTLVHRDYAGGLRLEIRDSGEWRSLYFADGQLQSRLCLARPWELTIPYTRYMAGALLLVPEPRNILVIGLGAGSLAHFFLHHFPHCRMTCVENSPQVIALARGFFGLPREDRLRVECRDGLEYVRAENASFDLLLVDAFDQQGMAAPIYHQGFFQRCAQLLGEDGILAGNLWSGNRLHYQRLREGLAACFSMVWQLPVPERGNVVVWAGEIDQPWQRLPSKGRALSDLARRYGLDLREILATAKTNNLNLAQRLLLALR